MRTVASPLADTDSIKCHTVSGDMSGGTGAGGHMWNVVTMPDGKNYLVDVTNCDQGTIGATDELFMAYTEDFSQDHQNHTFTINGQNISFTYYEDMKDLFCEGYLALSSTAYTAPTGVTVSLKSLLYPPAADSKLRHSAFPPLLPEPMIWWSPSQDT